MANSSNPAAAATAASTSPLPIQYTPFRKEDFASDSGVSFVNQTLSQLTTTLNSLVGAGGPTLLPAGIDVAGGKVTGLAAPTSPSDAISAGHAAANYSAPVLSQQLDIGGGSTLKGLAYTYQTSQSNQSAVTAIQATLAPGSGISGTLTIPKLTTGGANGSLTFKNGIITGFMQPT
jgi:hypothetical protein